MPLPYPYLSFLLQPNQIRYWLLIFYIFFSLNISQSQVIQSGTYNLYEGLSKGLIKSVATDRVGFVWVATDEGLIRFDGKNSTFFRNELPGGFAKAFLKRKNQSLLVVHDFGLTEIISEADTTYFKLLLPGLITDSEDQLFYPKTLYEDRQQQVWIGENKTLVRYAADKIKKYRFRPGTNSDSFYRAFSMAEDDNGVLWVLSYSGELYYYAAQQDKFVEVPLGFSVSRAVSLTKIKGNTFWLGGREGLFELDMQQFQVASWRRILSPGDISCTLHTPNGEFYVGTWNAGLFKTSIYNNPNSFSAISNLPFKDILSLAYDTINGVWVSGNENVVSLTPGFFKEINLGAANISISVLGMMPQGTLVAGNWQQLSFLRQNLEDLSVQIQAVPIELAPTAMLSDSTRLWIGTLSGNVYYYDLQAKVMKIVAEIKPSANNINKIIKDAAGNVWISGNERHGLIRIAVDGTFHYYNKDGLVNSRTIYNVSSGMILIGGVGSRSYLYVYDSTKDDFVNVSASLDFKVNEDFTVYDILMDRDGGFYLATTKGLLKFYFSGTDVLKSAQVRLIDLEKVPIDEPIRTIALSDDGILWVSTTVGLIAYDGKSSLLYDRSSGLPSNIITFNNLIFDQHKNLWVGTTKGLALFQRNLSRITMTPMPIFTAIQIDGIKHIRTKQNPFHLHSNSNLSLSFLTLSFPSDRVQYQTRLIGKDTSAWTSIGTQQTTLLSSLQPGTYTFQVRAQQHGGFQWSTPNAITFVVYRAWYQQWWAIGLFLLLFLLLTIGLGRTYSWRLLQQKRKLEEIVAARTEEINQQKNHIIEQNEQYRLLKEKQLEEQIEYKNKQLMIYTLHLIQKNESLKELQLEINKSIRQNDNKDKGELRHFASLIDYSFRKDDEWEKFKLYFESVHAHFFENLIKQHPSITPQELRLCALIRLNLSIPEMATILGISAESVKTARFRLRKKMELVQAASLVDHIMNF